MFARIPAMVSRADWLQPSGQNPRAWSQTSSAAAVAIMCGNILSRLRLVSEKIPCGCSSMIPFDSPSSAKAAVQVASS
ncbi:hypothetical protein [Mesorhizobium tianshanense]|uniref:hypothetical protein n=1 Tax=Mesorhizobium tianshanense TaxID=39844 RepID=UPI0013913589|nr:hypothetical protein [Mesorhizobium tianshanense]